jgi:hypothetical protein
MAMARWVLPVPVPPISTTLRCMGEEVAGGEVATSVSLIGVPVKSKSSMSLASGSLAIGHLVLDRAGLLLGDLGGQQVTDDARRFVLALDGGGHDLVIGAAHAVELELAHQVRISERSIISALLRLS